MTGMQWQVVIIRGGKIFVGLIFMVEGTHKNFNTTKIFVYMVHKPRLIVNTVFELTSLIAGRTDT